jgi:hypothetical protein
MFSDPYLPPGTTDADIDRVFDDHLDPEWNDVRDRLEDDSEQWLCDEKLLEVWDAQREEEQDEMDRRFFEHHYQPCMDGLLDWNGWS